jgi:hypothetical protein
MSTAVTEDLYDPEMVEREPELNKPGAKESERTGATADEEQGKMEQALQRLREYIDRSLSEPDAEAAMLGVCNGSLIKMLLRLEQAIDNALAESPTGASEHLPILARGIEMTLRLTWQVNRFTHLRLALKEAGEATARLTNG